MMAGTVLVSGGSGYIAGFLIRQLIREGWTVHTTIRNLEGERRVRARLATDNDRLHFFAADLTRDAGWADAMAGCTHVAHVASPFPAEHVKDANELIVPARDGALRALRFARDAGVRRFVLTSSVAAIGYGHPHAKTMFTEADWSDTTSPDTSPYAQSKTIAERVARDWIAAEGGEMEFASINPSLVVGPVMDADVSTSIEVIDKMLSGALPGCPDLGFAVVDVRDLVDLHISVLTAPDMANERFIASGRTFKLIEIARLFKARLGVRARKVPARRLPDFLVRIAALWDPMVRSVLPELGRTRHMDASHAKAILGWETRNEEDSLVDCANSLIDLGIVKV
ncbi:MAG: NAD-dependent epimerase/dehydratase family protein [Sphingomonadales bacterium]